MIRLRQAGLSLIEIMVAIVIATLLLLGLVQVFAASKSSYQLAEGLARVQENGRFAIDFIQRDLRMAGHFGCINDQSHLQKTAALDSHLAANGPTQFALSLQGYEAANTAPGGSVNLAAPSGAWTPALPAFIQNLNPAPLGGSDIIAVRYLRPEGVPITSIVSASGLTTLRFDPAGWQTLTQDGEPNPGLFGMADCNYADVFQATTVNSGTGTVTVQPNNMNTKDFAGQRYSDSPAGQTMLYRAESVVYYVAIPNGRNEPSLFRARFNSVPGGGNWTANAEELVEGVENLQFVMAQDRSVDTQQLTGYMGQMDTAAGAELGASEPGWRRVGMVQVGVVARSSNAAGAAQAAAANRLRSLGVEMVTAADDRRFRAVYETSVALRNRLYGN